MKVVLLSALVLLGCASELPPNLFAVDFVNARYPVMVSRAINCDGRAVNAKSGIYSSSSRTLETKLWNVVGASEQVAHEVQPDDQCVQLENIVFRALIARSAGRSERELSIDASVGP